MNILLDALPSAVEIDGKEYPINTDFRVGLKIMLAFEDPELTPQEKQLVMLTLLYPEVPENTAKASELALKFLNCGEDTVNAEDADEQPRVYSFEKDAKYIFTAINQTHGIDLEKAVNLHWWKFNALFLDLDENCFFNRLIDLRTRRSRGKLTKEEREYCAKISDILDLPQPISPEDKAAQDEFMRLLQG